MTSIPSSKFGWKIRHPQCHIPISELESLRYVSDNIADQVLTALDASNITVDQYLDEVCNSYNDKQSFTSKHNNNVLKDFSEEITRYPDWLDFNMLQEGQVFFYKYLGGAAMGLLYYSLIGGFSAPKIVTVLDQTAYLTKGSYDSTFKRLNETLEMILDCIEGQNNLTVGNKGWRSVLKVRFLHCKVRDRIHKQKKYDTQKYGIPINMEDLIGTLCSFSINIIETIKRIGAPVSKREELSYLHLWRYIGYLIGVDEKYNPCSSLERCIGTVESIVLHILTPDQRSKEVANHVLSSVSFRPLLNWSKVTHSECARALLGNELSDELDLERSLLSFLYIKVVLLFMFLFHYMIGYFNYSHDSKLIKKSKKLLRLAVTKALYSKD